jgi:hypothetical protein
MKISSIALLALSASPTTAFQPIRIHNNNYAPSHLHSTPFAQIAQMFTTSKTQVNGAVAVVTAEEATTGPGCIRKAGYDDDDKKVTFANGQVLRQSLGLNNEEKGGPGCFQLAGFDNEDTKVTYRNQEDLHEKRGIQVLNTVVKSLAAKPIVTETLAEETKPTPAKSAVVESPVQVQQEEEKPTNPNEKVYGVVNTKKLNKLYDLVVIGGGPAGVAGAIKAAQMGRRAILIDKVRFMYTLLLYYQSIHCRCSLIFFVYNYSSL